jgi:hypothetical protein
MSISPVAKYPSRVSPADASYPYGSAKNSAIPGDGTGTPWEKDLVNDFFGFQQALLAEASISPSGVPDTALLSQYLQGIKTISGANYETVSDMVLAKNARVGDLISVADYESGRNSGVMFFVAVAAGTGTADGFSFIDSSGTPSIQFKQNLPSVISVKKAGAVSGGVVDIGAVLQVMIDANEGQSILFDGQFLLDSAITSDKGIRLVGDIGSEIIIGPSFRSGVVFSIAASDIPNRSLNGFQCENIKFSGAFTPYLWLTDLSDTPIADPEADYVMGTGALASGISGVSLTSVLSGDGVASVTVNNGGAGWNNHPTHPYIPDTVLLKFVGDGYGAQGYGTIVGGTITSVTITKPGYGYTVAPTVTTQGGYADISLLVDPSVDRRNPGYINPTQLFQTKGTRNSWVRGCKFVDIVGRVIFDQGSLDLDVSCNYFENCGKEDGAFHVLYAQKHLTTPSENISFSNNRAKDIRRSFAAFNPTKGGALCCNYIDGYREAAVFMNEIANSDGGNIIIEGNTFKNGVVSDIVCHAVEAGGANNVKIHDNTIENCEEYPMVLTGNKSLQVYGNTFTNNGSEFAEPYGPFSERFTFNPGTLPTAGRENGLETRPLMATIGSFGALPAVRPNIHHNTINEDRAKYPKSVFRQVKSGTDSISIGGPLKDNILNIPSDVVLLDTEINDVWSEPFFPRIKDNINHVSESNVVHVKQFAAAETGTYTVDVGFMPTSVRVYAAANNKNVGRFGFGEFSWGDTDNDFAMISSVDVAGGTEYAGIVADEVVQTTTATGAIRFSAEFTSWNETGFTINVIKAVELTNVRFVCVP